MIRPALFVVARTAQLVDGRIAFGETHLFVGRGYVVSVRHGASTSYAVMRQRCESCPAVLSIRPFGTLSADTKLWCWALEMSFRWRNSRLDLIEKCPIG